MSQVKDNVNDSLLASFNERNSDVEGNGVENIDVQINDKLNDSDDRLNLEHEYEHDQELQDYDNDNDNEELGHLRGEEQIGSSSDQINRDVDHTFDEIPQVQTQGEVITGSSSSHFNLNNIRNNFNFLDRVFKNKQYQKLAGSSQSGPNSNDGVFNNLSAKPDTQPTIESDKPPTYEEAAADATPPYWEASVLAQGYTDEIFVDGLPVGNIVNFLWNLMVSTSFQFVGFLLTYILHTSHAAKQGSRAGLGLTFISYGYYMIPLSSSSLHENKQTTKIEPSNPNEFNQVDSEYEISGSVDEFHSSLSSGDHSGATTENFGSTSNGSFIAYLVIAFGVFIIIKALINYHRAKQMEKVILQPPTNLPVVEEV